ncbi:MAG: AAA family ATPase [Candidatus Omnitrophica bacterium]|jgi:CO dehydrogenase maturation factor|nr:AAA family ATPase [Candidatus Omnitrophota bacterium]MDD5079840.1 AAA family ATPase [Candidatus Omnitrophota bacterium]
MGHTIAIAGKGGTGKTTISGLIIRLIKDKKLGSVLGVDADPNSNLGEALGMKPQETISGILDAVAASPDKIPAGMTKDRFIEYQVQTIIEEGEGFDLLTMGRPEGPGCYCFVNNVLKNIMARLLADYKFVVIDNEAGLEHLSRKTQASLDRLIVVSDPSSAGLRAAKRISDLTRELKLKVKSKLLIINRQDKEIDKNRIKDLGLEYIGDVPEDKGIMDLSIKNDPVFKLKKNSPALSVLTGLLDKII